MQKTLSHIFTKKKKKIKQNQFLQLSQAAKLSNLWQKNTESTKENSAGLMTATVSFRSFKSEWDFM